MNVGDIMAPRAERHTDEYRSDKDLRIGAMLLAWGRLSEAHVRQILDRQEGRAEKFGEIGTAMGLVAEADVQAVLQHQGVHRPVALQTPAWPRELIAARPSADNDVEVFRALRLQLLKRWFGLGRGCATATTQAKSSSR